MKTYECWHVTVRKHGDDITDNTASFVKISNPLLYWAADPFVIKREGYYYIFAELYHRLLGKGRIGFCVLDEKGHRVRKWRIVLKGRRHFSFPYLYEECGSIFLMPESYQNRCVDVYRATNFPTEWKREKTLVSDERAADTVMLSKKSMWTYRVQSNPESLLCYELTDGKWELRQEYPDGEGVLRPGGKPFLKENDKYMPMQSMRDGEYGRTVRLVRIHEKDPLATAEDVYFEFSPETVTVSGEKNQLHGVHTYNFEELIEVVDYKTYTNNHLSFLGDILRSVYTAFRKCARRQT